MVSTRHGYATGRNTDCGHYRRHGGLRGLKPVAEIQFMGFIYAAMEHIVSHVSPTTESHPRPPELSTGHSCPFGGGIHAPEHHSEKVQRSVRPYSRAASGHSLLAGPNVWFAPGAIRSPDPVIFLEPKRIYRAVSQPVAVAKGEALPIDRCFTLREGHDITLISWEP